MTGWFFFMLWLGGIVPAYRVERRAGAGVVASAFDALCWVFNAGHELCKMLYISERDERW